MIPYGRQDIDDADVSAVVDVLRSDFLTTGPTIARFEDAMAAHAGVAHAIAVNSATSALHIACLALGLGPGDSLWTVPNTFVASANCARYCGASVDFVDINPVTWNIDVDALAHKLAEAEAAGALPRIVVPVHFAGQSCDMAAIGALAERYGFRVIEDASHAVGGSYAGRPVGCCAWSDITVFSFHPVKIMTTAEGGMALTADNDLAEAMRRMRSHGITRDPAAMQFSSTEPWYYEQLELGYNYRMTDLQAALGLSQMGRLPHFIERRNLLAERYEAAFVDLPVQRPQVAAGIRSSWHLYTLRIRTPFDRDLLFRQLRRDGIGVNVHYIPVHLQPYYRDLGFRPGQYPEAEAHGREALTLPLFAKMTDDEFDAVVAALRRVLI